MAELNLGTIEPGKVSLFTYYKLYFKVSLSISIKVSSGIINSKYSLAFTFKILSNLLFK